MSTYTPDRWAIVELVTPEETLHKILASWYGGYTGSDSWKISSGIVTVKYDPSQDAYVAENHSGSTYILDFGCYGASSYASAIYNGFADNIEKMGEGYSINLMGEEEAKLFLNSKDTNHDRQ